APTRLNKVFEIKVWDVAGGKPLTDLPAPEQKGKGRKGPAGAPPGRRGPPATGGAPAPATRGHTGVITCAAFSPDGATLATASWDGKVILWDVEKRTQKSTIRAHDMPVYGVAFSPDGATLASASADLTVKLWDAGTGKEVGSLTGHEKRVNSVAFSPDGERLASASDDGTVRVWQVKKKA